MKRTIYSQSIFWFVVFAIFASSTARAQTNPTSAVTYRFTQGSLTGQVAKPNSPTSTPTATTNDSSETADNTDTDDLDALLDTDVSQLRNTQVAPALQMEVSTVSRQKSTIGRSAAAVFVITSEMIHRSGSRSLPEVLRMAPGLHVAKIGSSKWSVSSRGFINTYNQQLLVQIDGRTVYTPIFGGVIWNWHDMLLEDIERIEVIRGPGSTVWGANAVNGVINIITKRAVDTTGVFVEGGGGTEERAFAGFRVGATESNGLSWRISGKWFDRDEGAHPSDIAYDGWEQGRLNMRADWESPSGDQLTLEGGMHEGKIGIAQYTPFIPFSVNQTPVAGGNLLLRWTRQFNEDSDTTVQVWADHYGSGNNRDFIMGNQTTIDIDMQHRRRWRERHRLIWGVGFRNIWDDLRTTTGLPLLDFDPDKESYYNASAFIQDEIELQPDKLFFTLGTKLSQNSFTDFEVQPNLRLLYAIDERSVAWGAVSRAVRIPSRSDLDLDITLVPGYLNSFGNPDLDAEPVMAYEVGYRKQPVSWFSWDATMFYNDYNDLAAYVPTSPSTLELFNTRDVSSYGAEISSLLEISKKWKLQSWYSFLRLNSRSGQPTASPVASPRNQAYLMSTYDLTPCSNVDLMARYVDDLRGQDIGSYIQADVRLAWRPRPHLEISIVGQNLFDSVHEEFVGSIFVPDVATLPERGVYGLIQYKY